MNTMYINTDQFNHFKIGLEGILETCIIIFEKVRFYKIYSKLVKNFAILVYFSVLIYFRWIK